MTSCFAHLTGHHDEGRGEPVAAEDLALGTDEGQVESHRGRRRQVWPGSGRLVAHVFRSEYSPLDPKPT